MASIRVRALWFQPEIGAEGYYGAILEDGCAVALCSSEKWDLGPVDSLREGWDGNVRRFPKGKRIHVDYTERQLRDDGLGRGALRLTVPTCLV